MEGKMFDRAAFDELEKKQQEDSATLKATQKKDRDSLIELAHEQGLKDNEQFDIEVEALDGNKRFDESREKIETLKSSIRQAVEQENYEMINVLSGEMLEAQETLVEIGGAKKVSPMPEEQVPVSQAVGQEKARAENDPAEEAPVYSENKRRIARKIAEKYGLPEGSDEYILSVVHDHETNLKLIDNALAMGFKLEEIPEALQVRHNLHKEARDDRGRKVIINALSISQIKEFLNAFPRLDCEASSLADILFEVFKIYDDREHSRKERDEEFYGVIIRNVAEAAEQLGVDDPIAAAEYCRERLQAKYYERRKAS